MRYTNVPFGLPVDMLTRVFLKFFVTQYYSSASSPAAAAENKLATSHAQILKIISIVATYILIRKSSISFHYWLKGTLLHSVCDYMLWTFVAYVVIILMRWDESDFTIQYIWLMIRFNMSTTDIMMRQACGEMRGGNSFIIISMLSINKRVWFTITMK